MLDGGANVDCSARSWSASPTSAPSTRATSSAAPSPVVGLLNVGEEEEKGNAVVQEAHRLLKQSPGLNYIGNIEGRDILAGHPKHGRVDVVVCDGFVGNVVLKFYESVARLIVGLVKRSAPRHPRAGRRCSEVFRILDYSEYGGAPLLGVQGRVHHLPRLLQRQRHQERHPGRGAVGRGRAQPAHRRRVRPARGRGPAHEPRARSRNCRRLGVAVPAGVVTNADLEKTLDTSDQWIVERTGIRERRIARPGAVAWPC